MKPQNLTFDSVDIGSPEETLRGLQTQRTTYAMAYNTLCKYVADVSFLPSFIRSIYVNNIQLLKLITGIVDWFPKLYLE